MPEGALTTRPPPQGDPTGALTELLARWSRAAARPIVLMLDEVDALVGDTLISLLRQIRAGYAQRPFAFPQALILCGVRDVRDYRFHDPGREVITGGSAFNIKSVSLRLGNFSPQEIAALYAQHTADTGQPFAAEIFPLLWEDTRGQPWLVNALGHAMTWEDRRARDRSVPLTRERYRAARERLIQSRATHLDQLTDKLREPRVRAVLEPVVSGGSLDADLLRDHIDYCIDLGLLERRLPEGLVVANGLYREVIPRELSATLEDNLQAGPPQSWYVGADGRLDLSGLLGAFQQFFREHSEAWLERFAYREAGPQLLLQAFLQRIVNGGGRIDREYGLGRGRTDLYVEWPLDPARGFTGPLQRAVIELKLLAQGPGGHPAGGPGADRRLCPALWGR
jgi:hypothetical protein